MLEAVGNSKMRGMAETGAGAEMLQDIVRRLSEELARHQQAMSSDVTTDYQTSAAAVKASSTAPEKSSVWPSSALSPLLVSYDRELAKKNAALDSQRLELLKVKEEMSLIVTENGLLHEELNRTKACLNDALGGTGDTYITQTRPHSALVHMNVCNQLEMCNLVMQ